MDKQAKIEKARAVYSAAVREQEYSLPDDDEILRRAHADHRARQKLRSRYRSFARRLAYVMLPILLCVGIAPSITPVRAYIAFYVQTVILGQAPATVVLSIDRAVLERSMPTNHGMYIADTYRIDGVQVEIIKEPLTVKSSYTSDKPLWHTAVLTNLPIGAPASCYEDEDTCIAIIEADDYRITIVVYRRDFSLLEEAANAISII